MQKSDTQGTGSTPNDLLKLMVSIFITNMELQVPAVKLKMDFPWFLILVCPNC